MTKDEIVVGLDDSDLSRAALKWAADQARLSGSTLRAVYVSDWPTGVRAGGRPLVVEDLVFVQEGELEHTNRAAITEIFREIAPKDDWSLEFAKGKSGQVLVDLSRHSRLLVVGTGEHVGLGRILLGSTSHFTASATRRARSSRFRLSMTARWVGRRRSSPLYGDDLGPRTAGPPRLRS